MAKPIKDTPSLSGKDSKEFKRNMDLAKNSKINAKEHERMMKNFHALTSIAHK